MTNWRRLLLRTAILLGAGVTGAGLMLLAGLMFVVLHHSPSTNTAILSNHPPVSAGNVGGSSTSVQIATSSQTQIPISSGHAYHAFEFIRNPYPDVGRLVEFDPWSFPIASRGFITYQRLDRNIATTTGRVGLRFSRDLSGNMLLYDVMLDNLQGDFMEGTDFIPAGQLAVQMSRVGLVPDTLQTWDVEPLGTIEDTTSAGLVVRIPLVRFWHYHDSQLDASEPTRIDIPPQKYGDGWAVEDPDEEIRTLPLQKRRVILDQKYDNSVRILNQYVSTIRDGEAKQAASALLSDAQEIRNQVHGPLLQAIRSGEIRDGHIPGPDWQWQLRNFNVENAIEEASDLLTRSGTARVEKARSLNEWQSEAATEFDRLRPEYQEFSASPPKLNCADSAQIKRYFHELAALISSANILHGDNDTDIRAFQSLHSEMLASELSDTLGCYQPDGLRHQN